MRRPRGRRRPAPAGAEDIGEQPGRALELALGYGGVRGIDLRVDLGFAERRAGEVAARSRPSGSRSKSGGGAVLVGREAVPRVHLAAREQRLQRTDVRQ